MDTTIGYIMAKRLAEPAIARVRLLTLELSEDAMTALAAAWQILLAAGGDSALETQTGASRDEVEAILQDFHTFLKEPAPLPMPG